MFAGVLARQKAESSVTEKPRIGHSVKLIVKNFGGALAFQRPRSDREQPIVGATLVVAQLPHA